MLGTSGGPAGPYRLHRSDALTARSQRGAPGGRRYSVKPTTACDWATKGGGVGGEGRGLGRTGMDIASDYDAVDALYS